MYDNREASIDSVMFDGRNLAMLSDDLCDDEEVVAAAILSQNYGGSIALSFASERLQSNPRLLKLVSIANDLDDLKARILQCSSEKKQLYLQQLRDKKKSILEQMYPKKRHIDSSDYYLDGLVIPGELKTIIDRAVIGTRLNYPDDNNIANLSYGIWMFFKSFVENPHLDYANDRFTELSDFISRRSQVFGIPLRKRIIDYYRGHNRYSILCDYGKSRGISDVEMFPSVLFSIDMLRLALKNADLADEKKNKILSFLKTIDLYLAAEKFAVDNAEDISLARQTQTTMQKLFEDISIEDISELLHSYFDSLDPKEVFKNDSIVIEEITDTAKEVLTNASEFALRDSFHAVLLDGKIDVASDKGYKGFSSKQEDAVGSAVYDDTHFINIVADGVGGAPDGAIGSKILVQELVDWYNSLPSYVLDDISTLTYELESKVAEVNKKLCEQYYGKAQTTLVLALTAGDKTIIVNIGDSTAYGYDESTDELVELTTLDSQSYGMSYEEARHNPYNNVITAAIGYDPNYELHTRVISNTGQRIILSSDGVTDLISERNFKNIFKNRIDAQRIVDKAKNNPDVAGIMKTEDNISAIVVDLPGMAYEMGRGY